MPTLIESLATGLLCVLVLAGIVFALLTVLGAARASADRARALHPSTGDNGVDGTCRRLD